MNVTLKYKSKRELAKAKRRNASLFPVYKMFSWDLIFFYSIQYLFLTITKGIPAGEILMAEAFYPLFIIILQLPAAICGEFLGRKRSIVIGNLFIVLHVLMLIVLPGVSSIIIGNIMYAFGHSLKVVQETNILYDSTATRGGEGLYPKINAQGASGYYLLDGIASLVAGYLFTINGYLPIYICLIFTIISTIIATRFKDIYINKIEHNQVSKMLKEYKEDFKYSVKNIMKSRRLRALLIYMGLFNAIITIVATYRGNILTELNVSPELYSIIIAVLTLLSGVGAIFQDKIHKKFRNKSLALLAMLHISSILVIGILLYTRVNNILPIVLIMLAIRNISMSNYYVLSERYSKNFSTPKTRTRISLATEFCTKIIEAILLFLAGMLLDATDIRSATLILALVFLMLFVLALDYMRKRLGLKPQEYKKKDIILE